MPLKQPDILANSPYYDDFDDAKNFLRTLFKPGYSVQARELTQIQTVLQNQISKFADHIFVDGSQVFGGKVFVTSTNFVRVEALTYDIITDTATTTSSQQILNSLIIPSEETVASDEYSSNRLTGTIQKLQGKIMRNVNGIYEDTGTILINHFDNSLDNGVDNYPVIYFSDITGNEGVLPGDLIHLFGTNNGTAFGYYFKVINPSLIETDLYTIAPSGTASLVKVDAGIYYIDGMFITNKSQILVPYELSDAGETEKSYETGNYAYTNASANIRLFRYPSNRVGLFINRQIITVDDDPSLRDPSNGIYNSNAPGADRYSVSLDIQQYPYDPQDVSVDNYANQDFIQIARIVYGRLDWIRRLPNYSQILDLFAQRTYDESGSYTVSPFDLEIKNHLRNDVYVYIVEGSPNDPANAQYLQVGSYIWSISSINPFDAGFDFEGASVGIGEIVSVESYKEIPAGSVEQTTSTTSKLIYVKSKNTKRISLGTPNVNGFGAVFYKRPPSANTATVSLNLQYKNFLIDRNGTFSVFDNPIGDSNKLNLGIQPGKAYVFGYETTLDYTKNLDYDKGTNPTGNTETKTVNLNSSSLMGNYVVASFANNVSTAIPDWETLPKFELQTSEIMTLVIEQSGLVQVTAPILYWSPFKSWSSSTTNYMLGLPTTYAQEKYESVIFIEE